MGCVGWLEGQEFGMRAMKNKKMQEVPSPESRGRRVFLCFTIILACSAGSAKWTYAAGPWLYEGGTPDMGTVPRAWDTGHGT